MYSFSPVEGTANQHLGLCLYLLAAFLYSAGMMIYYKKEGIIRERIREISISFAIIGAVGVLIAVLSFNTGSEYKNTPVVATLVESIERLESTKVSKHRYEDMPKMFVLYETPEGVVSFPRRSGIVYPDKVVLYKN